MGLQFEPDAFRPSNGGHREADGGRVVVGPERALLDEDQLLAGDGQAADVDRLLEPEKISFKIAGS